MPTEPLQRVLELIDRLNREDPNTDLVGGAARPRELVYAERLSAWVQRLNPHASEALQIAARGQHIQRWTIPRSRYPMTRQGYLRWRETLKTFHAQTVGTLMRQAGYTEGDIARVQLIISKRRLTDDADTQTLEDALCLVFLETQFTDLKHKTSDDKMRELIRKTWAKMSERGRSAAMQLPLGNEERTFLADALSGV